MTFEANEKVDRKMFWASINYSITSQSTSSNCLLVTDRSL